MKNSSTLSLKGVRIGILLRPQDKKVLKALQKRWTTMLGKPGATEIIRRSLLSAYNEPKGAED